MKSFNNIQKLTFYTTPEEDSIISYPRISFGAIRVQPLRGFRGQLLAQILFTKH